MRNCILILILSFLLLACNSQTDKKPTIVKHADSSAVTLKRKDSVRFFPEKKGIEKFDTLISSRNIQIIITKADLDSYVTNEYDEEGYKQIDKYRDAEIKLIIKQDSQTFLDTVFRKEQFSKYGDKGFMDIAVFHNYWFNNLNKNRLEFFGVISKPETDWTIGFNHYFDLTTKRMTFKQEISDY